MKTNRHRLTCRNGTEKVSVLLVHIPEKNLFWYALQGGHTVHLSYGKPFRSGKQLSNVRDTDVFTYYGNGTTQRPDNIADMETLTWLLRNK